MKPANLFIRLANALWYSIAIVVVMFALMVALGREFLPNISRKQDVIVANLSEMFGAHVELSRLDGRWDGFYPELFLDSARLDKKDIDVQIEGVKLSVNWLASLLYRTPVFKYLEVNRVDIAIVAHEQDIAFNYDDYEEIITAALENNLLVHNLYLHINKNGTEVHLAFGNVRINSEIQGSKVAMRLLGKGGHGHVDLLAKLDSSLESFNVNQGNFYIKAFDYPLSPLLELAARKLQMPPGSFSATDITGEAWIAWSGSNIDSVFDNIRLVQKTDEYKLRPARLRRENNGAWQLYYQQLDLQLLKETLFSSALQQHKPAALEDIRLLNPRGYLRDIKLVFEPGKALRDTFRLAARLDHVSVDAWHGAPALENVNGYINSGPLDGYIDLASADGFSMHYRTIYDAPMQYTKAKGRVGWFIDTDSRQVFVGGRKLTVSGEEGDAYGNFYLRLPLGHNDFVGEMYLVVGLRDTDASYRDKYLPNVLPPDLLQWLSGSIKAGHLQQAGFVYRGALSGQDPHARTIQFFGDIDGGKLDYAPGWPVLDNVSTRLLVDDTRVTATAIRARVLDSAIASTTVRVDASTHPTRLFIKGDIKGSGNDGLQVLRTSPIRDAIGDTVDSWVMDGNITTSLDLDIPLGEHSNTTALHDVTVALENNTLRMKNLNLAFSGLQGNVMYSNTKGLSAIALQGQLWRHPVKASINSTLKQGAMVATRITLDGSTGVSDVANWTGLDYLNLLRGKARYKAVLDIDGTHGDNADAARIGSLLVTSDMKDVVSGLPAPFAKASGDTVPLQLQGTLYRNRQDISIAYGSLLNTAVRLGTSGFESANMCICDQPQPWIEQRGEFRVSGTLPRFDYTEWKAALVSNPAVVGQAGGSSLAGINPVIDVQIGELVAGKYVIADCSIHVTRATGAWEVMLDAEHIKGTIREHDTNPVTAVNLDYLYIGAGAPWATPEGAVAGNSTVAGNIENPDVTPSPSTMTPFDLSIDKLQYNQTDMGKWSMKMRPQGNVLQVQDVIGNTPDLMVGGIENPGAKFVWDANKSSSQFTGMLTLQGEQKTLLSMGMTPFVNSEKMTVVANLDWQGGPTDFAKDNLHGAVVLHGRNGRYLKAKTSTVMKLINIINFDTWLRRFKMDFADLRTEGVSFDKFTGVILMRDGKISFKPALKVESPSSEMTMSGDVDLVNETLALEMVVTLPVTSNAPWIAAIAGGLPAAVGVYIVGRLFEEEIDNVSSLVYSINGSMDEPDIEFSRITKPDKENQRKE